MTALATTLDTLAATREQTLVALAGLPDELLNRPVSWRSGRQELRFLLLQIVDLDDERRLDLAATLARAGHRPTMVQAVLGDAVRARGRLLGALVGVEDALLDVPPGPGEWPLRIVIGHMINTARRYTLQSRYAADRMARGGEGPLRMAEHLLPPVTADGIVSPDGSPAGSVAAIRRALLGDLAATLDTLAPIEDRFLDAPANWIGVDVDLRFRLHRIAAHERQHLIQVRKTQDGAGFRPTEAHLTLGEAEIARAELLAGLVGVTDERAVARPDGARYALDVLTEAGETERALVTQILAVAEGG